ASTWWRCSAEAAACPPGCPAPVGMVRPPAAGRGHGACEHASCTVPGQNHRMAMPAGCVLARTGPSERSHSMARLASSRRLWSCWRRYSDRRLPVVGPYLALMSAIVCEVIGTSLLQHSRQFTRLWPTVGMALFYLTSCYLLSLALRGLSLGIAYAIWSGVGIVLVALVGFLAFNQRIDLPGVIGLSMIVGGVLVVNLFSHSV